MCFGVQKLVTVYLVLTFCALLQAADKTLALHHALEEIALQKPKGLEQQLSWWVTQIKKQPSKLPDSAAWHSLVPADIYRDQLKVVTDLLRAEQLRTDINSSSGLSTGHDLLFAQKKIVADDSSLYWITDLRGDLHTLVAILEYLQRVEKVLSDDFVLSGQKSMKNITLVFAGNYVDTGTYGAEILYLISLLKQNNPDKVILLRGRHEAVGMNSRSFSDRGGFLKELQNKFSSINTHELTELHKEFYKFLPATLYMGCKHSSHTNYLQFVSSGLEFYNPQSLLSSKNNDATEIIASVGGESLYSQIRSIAKKSIMAVMKKTEEIANKNIESQDRIFADLPESSMNPHKAFVPSSHNSNFMWSTFKDIPGSNRVMTQVNARGDAILWGELFVDALLRLPDYDAHQLTIVGVMRGYQDQVTMPQLFYPENKNMYRLSWGTLGQQVIMSLISTPQLGLPGRCFGKIELNPLNKPEDWGFIRYFTSCTDVTCGAWEQTKDQLFTWSNVKNEVALCGNAMHPVWNSTGTCFLNAALQIWRVLFCIAPVRSEMSVFYGSKFTDVRDREINRTIFSAVHNFLQGYDQKYESERAGAKHREALLKKVQAALEVRDKRLKEEEMFSGRTHLTMVLLQDALLAAPSLITPDTASSFDSQVGFVLNELSSKKQFEESAKDMVLSGVQKLRMDALNEAQASNNYIALPLARAIGLKAFLAEEKFRWPKALIISTTRKNPETGQYEKVVYKKTEQREKEALLQTTVPGSDAVKFTVEFDPVTCGFPAHPTAYAAPAYRLIGFTAKIPGHALAVVNFAGKWWSCSNQEVVVIPGGEEAIKKAGESGYLEHGYFGKLSKDKVIPEVLVYERTDY